MKLYLYAAALLAILGLLWVVNGWREDSRELEGVKKALDAELNCFEKSRCALRLIESANHASEMVKSAQRAADEYADNERRNHERAEKAATDKLVNDLNRTHQSLLQWQRKFEAEKARDLSCREWAEQKVACGI